MDRQQVIQGLIRLNWSDRAIPQRDGEHRKTISLYRKQFQMCRKCHRLQARRFQNVPQVPADPAGTYQEIPAMTLPPFHHLRTAKRLCLIVRLSAPIFYRDYRPAYLSGFGLSSTTSAEVTTASSDTFVNSRNAIKRFFERLPTLPGREAQVDFAKSPCKVLVTGNTGMSGFSR